jgi:ribosomal-protein-alanine N-acetyltransferase
VQFRLRDFRQEDFDTLWGIDQRCFARGVAYSRPELDAYMEHPGSFTLVAEAETSEGNNPGHNTLSILGFLVAHPPNRRGLGHIVTIDVLPEAQRSGVGSRLLLAAEDRLRAAQGRGVSLETAVDNQPAITFYKRHGYFVIKTLPRYYSNGVDAFLMRKDLHSAAQAS